MGDNERREYERGKLRQSQKINDLQTKDEKLSQVEKEYRLKNRELMRQLSIARGTARTTKSRKNRGQSTQGNLSDTDDDRSARGRRRTSNPRNSTYGSRGGSG